MILASAWIVGLVMFVLGLALYAEWQSYDPFWSSVLFVVGLIVTTTAAVLSFGWLAGVGAFVIGFLITFLVQVLA